MLSIEQISKGAFIAGQWVGSSDGETFAVSDPATGAVLAHLPDLTAQDCVKAIEAAQRAFLNWRKTPAKDRARLMRRWNDLILTHQDDLASILSREQGKPLSEAKGEIAYGASFIEWFAEEGRRIYGDVIPSPTDGRRLFAFKEPIGVAGAITPWNFPNAMIARKVAPALAAGCASVVKPAAQTPLSALALAVLAKEAGLPDGLINIVTSDRATEIGEVLTRHPLVRKVSFTGSTEVGRIIMRQSADTIKKLSLELGGNAPFLVFDDADLDAAVTGAMASKYRNSGQTCVCANRFYVQSAVYDAFAQKLTAAVGRLKIGSPFEPGVDQGPLINKKALEKVERLVADAIEKGAQVLIGAKRSPLGGNFYLPTVLTQVPRDALALRKEIFGPVAPLVRFESEDEAISLANDSEYGLAAYFYARDNARVFRVASALEAGIVGVNEGLVSTAEAPFGGVKQSGLGREGSRYGIEDYLEIKYVCMGAMTESGL